MKVLGHGLFTSRALALRYALGLPGVSLAIVGLDTPEQVDEMASLAAAYRPLEPQEEDQLVAEVRPLVEQDARAQGQGEQALFWLHDTAVMGWQQQDEPLLVSY